MAGQRIDIMELRQLIQLKQEGISNRKIAEMLGISRNTVNSYVRTFDEHGLSYQALEELSDSELAGLFPKADYKDSQRYGQLASYFPTFAKELQKTGCTLQTLWDGYLGRSSRWVSLYAICTLFPPMGGQDEGQRNSSS